MSLTSLSGLLVATLGGAAIGLERQWSGHASGPDARFGGIRTFTMLGGIAGLAGWLSVNGLELLAVALLAGAAALVAIGYAAAARSDIDGTTEVAALVVLTAGTLAGSGRLALASGVIAATALLLLEKTRLHALVSQIDDVSLRASARFAALACIVLPLLPTGPYGPYGAVRPRELWALVLFFSGLRNPPLALAVPRYLWPAFVIGLLALLLLWRANADEAEGTVMPGSPLQLRTALQMTALFQGVLFLILAVQSRWGSQALVGTAAFIGLTDLDALTLSLARSTTVDAKVPDAAVALTVGVLSNTILKLGTALAIGRGRFRIATAVTLAAMAGATILALVAQWPER